MDEKTFNYFFILWMILGFVSFCFFTFYKNTQVKRKLFAPYIIFVGVLFGGIVLFSTKELWTLYFLVPSIALISYMNIKNSKFCDACGKLSYNYALFPKMRYCSKCGTELD